MLARSQTVLPLQYRVGRGSGARRHAAACTPGASRLTFRVIACRPACGTERAPAFLREMRRGGQTKSGSALANRALPALRVLPPFIGTSNATRAPAYQFIAIARPIARGFSEQLSAAPRETH